MSSRAGPLSTRESLVPASSFQSCTASSMLPRSASELELVLSDIGSQGSKMMSMVVSPFPPHPAEARRNASVAEPIGSSCTEPTDYVALGLFGQGAVSGRDTQRDTTRLNVSWCGRGDPSLRRTLP